MADETKPKLSEEEIIARKLKLRKTLSTTFLVVATVSIIAFIVLMFLSRQNVSTQTSIDTQEMRSKLKQLVALERLYYEETGQLSDIRYLALSREIDRFNPNVDGSFRYRFDTRTGIATGREKDSSYDVNGDEDGNDGLTLSINWEPGVTDESDFFWTEEDIADFEARRARDDFSHLEITQ
ncbi:hypothetical protein ACFL5H_02990 [Candidatus Latescibacterota bacterium]